MTKSAGGAAAVPLKFKKSDDAKTAFANAIAKAKPGVRILLSSTSAESFAAHPCGVIANVNGKLVLNETDVVAVLPEHFAWYDVDDLSGTIVIATEQDRRRKKGGIVTVQKIITVKNQTLYSGNYDDARPTVDGVVVCKTIALNAEPVKRAPEKNGSLETLAGKKGSKKEPEPALEPAGGEVLRMLVHCTVEGEQPIGCVSDSDKWFPTGRTVVAREGRKLYAYAVTGGEKTLLHYHTQDIAAFAANAKTFVVQSGGFLWRNGSEKICPAMPDTPWALIGTDVVVERTVAGTKALFVNGTDEVPTGAYARWVPHKHGFLTETPDAQLVLTVWQVGAAND